MTQQTNRPPQSASTAVAQRATMTAKLAEIEATASKYTVAALSAVSGALIAYLTLFPRTGQLVGAGVTLQAVAQDQHGAAGVTINEFDSFITKGPNQHGAARQQA